MAQALLVYPLGDTVTDPNYTRIRDDVLSDLGWSDDDPNVAATSLTELQQLLAGDPTGQLRRIVITLWNSLKGDKGDTGPANTLTIGTVESGDAPSATITGVSPNQILSLVLAKGPKGDQGDPGTFSPATTTTQGTVKLAGDLAGTADLPTVPSLSGKAPINNPTFTGTVGGITKSMVGLANVDNTSDVNKPVSTAQQTAINAKYTKPGTGVPKTDLDAAVQTSLGKADTATQPGDLGTAASASATSFASSTQGGVEKVAAGSATTGTVTLNCANASVFTISPTGNITLAPTNVPASGTACTITIIINQGATAYTLTMPGTSVWLGSAPTQTASKKCVVTMLTTDGGTSWISSASVQA